MRIKYSLFILFYSSFSIANAQVHVGPGQSYPNIQAQQMQVLFCLAIRFFCMPGLMQVIRR